MHPNPVFHTADAARNLDFARERAFGVLAVSGPDLPMLAHVPFLVAPDGAEVDLHLVRSNPIARALSAPQSARIAVSGPDSYISPDWYDVDDQVPTWNYVAVQISGTLERLPDDALLDILERQSALFEARLLPKPPWTMDKLSADQRTRLMRMIVPCRMRVTGVDGTWKLNQNKPDAARARAADHVRAFGQGMELSALAALMHGADPADT